jgi:hypothetical protein
VKFSIGDRVWMKRTGEEGIITAFLGEGLIEVDIAGLRFPVYEDELEHPYLHWFTKPKKKVRSLKEAAPEKQTPPRLSRGIYLSFLPVFAPAHGEEIIEAFRIHFINETSGALQFSYEAKTASGRSLLHLSSTMAPFSSIYLHSLSLEELNAQPRFFWNLAPTERPASGRSDVLRIRPPQLLRYIKALLEDGAPSFSILLSDDAEALPPQTPSQVPLTPPAKVKMRDTQPKAEPVAVLDLHMDGDDAAGGQLLAAQLRLLEQKLHDAFIAGQESMIVIHGIGTGALREAVHGMLRETPFVNGFRNEWMPGYGWGATLISFRT